MKSDNQFICLDQDFPDTREFYALQEFAKICIKTGFVDRAKTIIEKLYGDLEIQSVTYIILESGKELGPFPFTIADQIMLEMRDAIKANVYSYDTILEHGIYKELNAQI